MILTRTQWNIFTPFLLVHMLLLQFHIYFSICKIIFKLIHRLSNFYLYSCVNSPTATSIYVFNCSRLIGHLCVPIKCRKYMDEWIGESYRSTPSWKTAKWWTKLCVLQSKRQERSTSRQIGRKDHDVFEHQNKDWKKKPPCYNS